MSTMWRSRWAAVGAAVAITLGAGGIGIVDATKSSGERAVYTAIEPCRLLDTRPNEGIGGRTTPLGPGEVYGLTAHGDNGQCTGIPNDTVALELNVTGLFNTGATHFTIWSGAGAVPNASHVNLAPGASPTPNSVTTELDGAGFAIRNNSATSHVIIDIVGVYQDHNHDDRYYTETESDDRYYTKTEIDAMKPTSVSSRVDSSLALDGTNRSVTAISVTPGSDGQMIVNSSVTVFESTEDQGVECSLSLTAGFDEAYGQKWVSPGTDPNVASQLSGTRSVDVTAGVETTVTLVCRQTGGGTANLFDAVLTGVIVAD